MYQGPYVYYLQIPLYLAKQTSRSLCWWKEWGSARLGTKTKVMQSLQGQAHDLKLVCLSGLGYFSKVRCYCKALSNCILLEIQTERAISTARGKERRDPSSFAHTSEVRRMGFLATQMCRLRQWQTNPEPRQAGCTDLRARLLRTAGRKWGVNFLSLKDSLKARWGISINLQIYPKFSKFTMTNVTVHLNWSSSLGSCGSLEKMPATRTWKEINL